MIDSLTGRSNAINIFPKIRRFRRPCSISKLYVLCRLPSLDVVGMRYSSESSGVVKSMDWNYDSKFRRFPFSVTDDITYISILMRHNYFHFLGFQSASKICLR